MSAEPNACRHCNLPDRGHFQRWTKAAGWHKWSAPTDEQIKARMIARRNAPASPAPVAPSTPPGATQGIAGGDSVRD